MRELLKKISICFLILLLFGGVTVSAEEAKQLVPMFLVGTVYIGDDVAPVGTVLYADIPSVIPNAGLVSIGENGVYGTEDQPMMVQAGANETLRGSPVTFTIGNVEADEVLIYEPGTTQFIDLHFNSAAKSKLNVVPMGGDVFIGEEGLDVSLFLSAGDQISWSTAVSAINTITIDNPKSLYINPAQYIGKTGDWIIETGDKAGQIAFVVKDPSIGMKIWDQDQNGVVESGGNIPAGDGVNFRIETNLYSAILQRGGDLSDEDLGIINIVGSSNTTKMTYKSLQGLLNETSAEIPLTNLVVNQNIWFWPQNDNKASEWSTGYLSSDGNRLYPNGLYEFYGVATLNNINKNYPVDSTGKTHTSVLSANLVDEGISVEIDVPSITRGNSFFVTIGGRADTDYIITIMECDPAVTDIQECCTLKMSGAPCDRPPMIRSDQSGVSEGNIVFDPENGPFNVGETPLVAEGCSSRGYVRDAVPTDDKPNAKDVLSNGIYYYALIHTDGDNDPAPGYRTVEFKVDNDVLADRPYRIHVQSINADTNKVLTGDGRVDILKGKLTIETVETAPFYLGNDITFKGTNTDSKFVYLFMTGDQCQNKCGNDLLYLKEANTEKNVVQPGIDMIKLGCVEESSEFTAIEVPVKSDGTWEYVWRTEEVPINPGNYKIYASSQPINACCIDCACAVTAFLDVELLKPEIIAEIDPSTIVKPIECCANGCSWTSLDAVTLSGIATGFPHTGSDYNATAELNMWIFGAEKIGNEKYINAKIPVFGDDTFEVNLLNYIDLCSIKPGCYSVILQHPMYNHKFDMVAEGDAGVKPEPNQVWMVTSYPTEWSKLFPLDGPSYYQGEKAVTAIKEFLDEGKVDDTYVVLQFCVQDDRVPHAAFSANPLSGNRPLEVQFTDESTGKNLSVWSWDFGDGNKLTETTERNPAHTYNDVGVYTVSLTVMNKDGVSDMATKPDYINVREPKIKADFCAAPTSGAAPLEVMFTDKSTGSPSNWFWDFGDGSTSTGVRNPTHVYTYGGTYTVTLTITLGEEVDRKVIEDYIVVSGQPGPSPTVTPIDPTEIPLYPGWNFVSVARTLADGANTAGVVFGDVATGGHAIWGYDPYGQFWDQALSGTEIQPLYGYWIYSVNQDTVILSFKNSAVSTPVVRNLPTGWAAIGFTGATPSKADDTLKSVSNSWIYARGYDSSSQQWESTMVNGGQGADTYMYPSKGYWLYMEQPGTLAAIGA